MKTFAHTIHYLRTLFRTKRSNPLHMFDYSDDWPVGRQGNRVVINVATKRGDSDVTLITLYAPEARGLATRLVKAADEANSRPHRSEDRRRAAR